MRFIIDNNLSWRLAVLLNERGHDAVHVRDLGLSAADDPDIFTLAARESRVIVAQDLDFGTLMAATRNHGVNVILFRLRDGRPETQTDAIVKHLAVLEKELTGGTIAVITESRLRIRRWSR